MRRLQIGMWHEFCPERWDTYNLGLIDGLEISQYRSEDELERVRRFCGEAGISFGIHGPVLGGYPLPKINSVAEAERREALARVAEEAKIAARFGADYLLIHYPFLPVFQLPIKKFFPRMPGPNDRYGYEQLSSRQFRSISGELFETLCDLQVRTNLRILLEHDFFGDYGDIFLEMFERYPEIKLVVDTARLDVTARAFDRFDPYDWLARVAPHVYLVHYSNVRYEGETFRHHLPVLPAHDDDPDYGDAHRYLAYLSSRNQAFHVTFEHRADLVGPEELKGIYLRVVDLLRSGA